MDVRKEARRICVVHRHFLRKTGCGGRYLGFGAVEGKEGATERARERDGWLEGVLLEGSWERRGRPATRWVAKAVKRETRKRTWQMVRLIANWSYAKSYCHARTHTHAISQLSRRLAQPHLSARPSTLHQMHREAAREDAPNTVRQILVRLDETRRSSPALPAPQPRGIPSPLPFQSRLGEPLTLRERRTGHAQCEPRCRTRSRPSRQMLPLLELSASLPGRPNQSLPQSEWVRSVNFLCKVDNFVFFGAGR